MVLVVCVEIWNRFLCRVVWERMDLMVYRGIQEWRLYKLVLAVSFFFFLQKSAHVNLIEYHELTHNIFHNNCRVTRDKKESMEWWVHQFLGLYFMQIYYFYLIIIYSNIRNRDAYLWLCVSIRQHVEFVLLTN